MCGMIENTISLCQYIPSNVPIAKILVDAMIARRDSLEKNIG
jgi:hypothetical protein